MQTTNVSVGVMIGLTLTARLGQGQEVTGGLVDVNVFDEIGSIGVFTAQFDVRHPMLDQESNDHEHHYDG